MPYQEPTPNVRLKIQIDLIKIDRIRKYPLCGYILGVLTHTTTWDQHWGGNETLKCGLKLVIRS